mgnify:CR=1 FL=1
MTKVFLVNGVNGNVLETGVINNGKYLKFTYNGNYIGEYPVPFNADYIREIDMVSILNVDNNIEVAYVLNNKFHKLRVFTDINKLIKGISSLTNGNLFVGRREEQISGIEYIQYLYGYKRGSINEKTLLEVLKVNGSK